MTIFRSAVMVTFCLLLQPTDASEGSAAQRIAERYHAARTSHLPFPDILQDAATLTDAFLYDVQKEFVAMQRRNGATVGGYKGGFIPKSPIGGVLFSDGIISGNPTIESQNFHTLLVEAEIAFQLCENLDTPLADVDALKAATCHVYPAIELPDAALPNLDELLGDFPRLRKLLVPTNMAVSHVLLGKAKNPATIDLNRLDVRVRLDGAIIGFRDGATVADDIWSRVLWVINEFVIAQGYAVTAEHIIIPGALTGIHPGKPGLYNIDYGVLGNIEFRIQP